MQPVPLMCILSTLTTAAVGYLPDSDLTNSIAIPERGPIEIPDLEETGDPEGEEENGSDFYKAKTTFRRRNINAGYGARVPFSRMAYKAGYGANRFNGRAGYPSYRERAFGGYGGNSDNSYNGYPDGRDEIYGNYARPPASYSGLMGPGKNGYYGSANARPMKPYDYKKPYERESPEYPPSNDLMNSFSSQKPRSYREFGGSMNSNNNNGYGRYTNNAAGAAAYIRDKERDRFGAVDSSYGMGGFPTAYIGGPQIPSGRGVHESMGRPDYNYNIASNQWNGDKPMKIAKDKAMIIEDTYNDQYKNKKVKAKAVAAAVAKKSA